MARWKVEGNMGPGKCGLSTMVSSILYDRNWDALGFTSSVLPNFSTTLAPFQSVLDILCLFLQSSPPSNLRRLPIMDCSKAPLVSDFLHIWPIKVIGRKWEGGRQKKAENGIIFLPCQGVALQWLSSSI